MIGLKNISKDTFIFCKAAYARFDPDSYSNSEDLAQKLVNNTIVPIYWWKEICFHIYDITSAEYIGKYDFHGFCTGNTLLSIEGMGRIPVDIKWPVFKQIISEMNRGDIFDFSQYLENKSQANDPHLDLLDDLIPEV